MSWKPSMKAKISRRASATTVKRRRSRSSHSSVAKRLSHIALFVGVAHRTHRLSDARLPAPLPERQGRVLGALDALMFVKRATAR